MKLFIRREVASFQVPGFTSIIIDIEVLDVTKDQISHIHQKRGVKKGSVHVVNHMGETDRLSDLTKIDIDLEADMKISISLDVVTASQRTRIDVNQAILGGVLEVETEDSHQNR